MKSGSTALVPSDVPPTTPLVIGSNSRRAKAINIHAAGDCPGAVGALLANGDSTALITVDTMRDKGSAGVGVMTVEAGVGAPTAGAALEDVGAGVTAAAGVAAADGAAGANDGRPAGTTRTASRRLGRVVASVGGTSTTSGFGLVFTDVLIDVLSDAGREVTRTLRRAAVRGASTVAGVVAASVDEVEVSGRGSSLAGSFVADTAVFSEGVSGDIEPESCDELDGDDPPDDEPLPESAGAANATAGVLATAIPMPSATASAQMPPMCFAFSMVAPFAHPRRVNGRW
jgi:hypothetical protein